MPFIAPERRPQVDAGEIAEVDLQPGDRCYRYYKRMVDLWRDEPRWTTAHKIYKTLFVGHKNVDELVAKQLAWQVFFTLHVIEYEKKKREENGDI